MNKIKNMTYTALISALLCVTGPLVIPLPFSPVPISAITLIIYISSIAVGFRKGAIAVLLYLLIGMLGLPVFSNFTGGLGKLIGATGGYLIGYIFIAMVTGYFSEKFKGKIYMYAVGMLLGTLLCYAWGTLWLSFSSGLSLKKALLAGVVPFLIGDLIKIFIAVLIGEKIRIGIKKIK